jgi:DNA polymerase eta
MEKAKSTGLYLMDIILLKTLLRNRAVPGFLKDFKFTKIRMCELSRDLMVGNLGGKFGAEVASVFDTDQVSDLWNISVDQLRAKLGPEQGSWVYNTCRGIDYSEVNTRTKIKSMLRFPSIVYDTDGSAKNFQPPLNNTASASRWLRILTADLASRINEDADHRLPKTLTIHHRSGGQTKSRQAPLPLSKEMDKEFLFTHALSLWRVIEAEGRAFPAINISVAISGFGDVEEGVQGIKGFLVSGPQTHNGPSSHAAPMDVLGKRKRDDSGIARFFPKRDDSSPEHGGGVEDDVVTEDIEIEDPAGETYLCGQCQKPIPLQDMEVHEDYHVALDLSRESVPVRTVPAVQSRTKRVSKDEKKGPKKKGKPVEKGQKKLEFGM